MRTDVYEMIAVAPLPPFGCFFLFVFQKRAGFGEGGGNIRKVAGEEKKKKNPA